MDQLLFQSSPFPKEGRYIKSRTASVGPFRFNPRPSRRKGATHRVVVVRLLQAFQSSPFPKEGRYTSQSGRPAAVMGFNPRPSRRKGATVFIGQPRLRTPVSILALPEGRALLDISCPRTAWSAVSILALPEGRALRRHARHSSASKIVSILALPEGRALPPSRRKSIFQSSFQSSPFPKEGRYLGDRLPIRLAGIVSILALPEGRALRE